MKREPQTIWYRERKKERTRTPKRICGKPTQQKTPPEGGIAFYQARAATDDDADMGYDDLKNGFSGDSEPSASYERPYEVLPTESVGLDRLSTVDLFYDDRWLANIRKYDRTMQVRCNAGITELNQVGEIWGRVVRFQRGD